MKGLPGAPTTARFLYIAIAESKDKLRKLRRDAVFRLKVGKFFAGESDQSKGRELQIVIFGDLLEKQLSEATSRQPPAGHTQLPVSVSVAHF